MRRHFLLALLLVLVLTLGACSSRDRGKIKGADASPDAVPSLLGTYAVNGVDPLGVEYGGTLSIMPGPGPTQYALQWIVTGSIQEGIGIVRGNQLLVEWRTIEGMGNGASGVTTYTITTEGELYGARTVVGQERAGQEDAFPNDYD
jgi:hypothetical protein